MKTIIQLILVLTMSITMTYGQTITITRGSNWDDAMIAKNEHPSYTSTDNTNYGTRDKIQAIAWTHSGTIPLEGL